MILGWYFSKKRETWILNAFLVFTSFLYFVQVNLDPMYYIVYNKTRKLHATLNEPISQLINKFRRKASITVTVVKLQAPNPTFSPPMNVQQQNGTRRLSVPNPIRSASGSRFPEDELHLNVDEEEALVSRM